MDSFFAAAENLDHLLDELEEREEESSAVDNHNTSTISSSTVNDRPPAGLAPADLQNNVTPVHARKLMLPTSILTESPDDIPSNAGLKNAVAGNKRHATSLADIAQMNHDTIAKTDALNPKSEISLVPQKLDSFDCASCLSGFSSKIIELDESCSPLAVEAPHAEKLTSPHSEFVVIENCDIVNDNPQVNSDVFMEIFGVEPAQQIVTVDSIPESEVLSPLNPFSSSFAQTLADDVSQAPDPSGIFDPTALNRGVGFQQDNPPVLRRTNPFFVDQNETLPEAMAIDFDDQLQTVKVPRDATAPPSTAYFTNHTNDEVTSNIVKVSSEKSQTQTDSVEYSSAASGTQATAALNMDVKSDVSHTMSQNLVEPATESAALASSLAAGNAPFSVTPVVQEKRENFPVGFMRDVAVSEEEFERFMAEMEADETGKAPSGSTAPTSDPGKFDDSEITNERTEPPSVPSQDSPKINTAPMVTDVRVSGNTGDADVCSGTSERANEQSFDNDLAIASAIPQDDLISESEFEQFLSTEIDASTNAEMDISPDTLVPASSGPDLPDAGTSNRDGSPTFLLPPRSPPQVEVTRPTEDPASPQPASEPQSGNGLTLNIEERSTEAVETGSGYPATPPPPYTEEMHANFERSRSPPMQLSIQGQQPTEQEHRDVNELLPQQLHNGDEADDFLHLPSSVLDLIERPGERKPTWVPDENAPQCSNCSNKFTFTRRRHHCRACGRVFCAQCCSEKSQLKYIDYKEARVCLMCSLAIKQADALAVQMRQRSSQSAQLRFPSIPVAPLAPTGEAAEATAVAPDLPQLETLAHNEDTGVVAQEFGPRMPPQNPQEDSVALPEDVEVECAMSGVPGTKSVRFSDGTRPKHPDEIPVTPPPPSRISRPKRKLPKDANGVEIAELPPVIIAHGENGAYAVQENPDPNVILSLLESGDQNPQSFVLNPNLILHVKVVSYASRQCWCYWSEGMDSVGQREVVLLLEREGLGDRRIASDAFTFYRHVFDRARKGKIFNTADFMPRTMLGMEDEEQLFGLERNAGFMFVQASSQALDGLSCLKKKVLQYADGCGNADSDVLPVRSMLFAIMVQKDEAPWATLFPMRLMLRLGMEMKHYPCPLFSVRRREPVFYELGHTILAILCDFRNFKYRVINVPGLRVVVMGTGSVSVQIPCNRFADTVRIMNSSNESVLAIGTGTYGPKIPAHDGISSASDAPCESHLVCVQDQETSGYHTELLTMKDTSAMNTGATFVIFNGSLKSDGNHTAKCAIVEDGIMIQLLREKMEELRASLKSMEDFQVEMAGPTENSEQHQAPPVLEVKWVEDDTAFNIGMFSPIDGTPFEGVIGFNVQGKSEQRGKRHVLRWNQVFFLASTSDPLDTSRLAEQVANGCFLALTPVLHVLAKHRQHKLAVRVTIHPENVGYAAGSGLHDLPLACMNALDEHLIQTIHSAANSVAVEQEAVVIELLFSILLSRPAYRTA